MQDTSNVSPSSRGIGRSAGKVIVGLLAVVGLVSMCCFGTAVMRGFVSGFISGFTGADEQTEPPAIQVTILATVPARPTTIVPSPSVSSSPMPSPTATADGEAAVSPTTHLEQQIWRRDDPNEKGTRWYHVVLTNTNPFPVHEVSMKLELRDAAGKVVALSRQLTNDFRVIPAGKVYPAILYAEAVPDGELTEQWTIEAERYEPATDAGSFSDYSDRVRIDYADMREASSYKNLLTGQVTNIGDAKTFLISIYVVVYDEAGAPVRIESGSPVNYKLGPNESSAFSVAVFPSDMARYEVVLEASQD